MNPTHMKWFQSIDEINLTNGNVIKVYNFNHCNDDSIMDEWAKYFREHYCLEEEIDILREGTGFSREEYLLNMKFPDEKEAFGPATRSGDFAEILVADYLQYILNHYVPRTRYDRKTVKNESTKGSDVIGFMIKNNNKVSKDDSILIFEVKATFSGNQKKNRLQDAVNDSIKDPLRLSESLNAIKQRLLDRQDYEGCKKVIRFQDKLDRPYKLNLGAVAMVNTSLYDKNIFKSVDLSMHKEDIELIVVKGNNMMKLVHELYRRASKC